MTPKPGIYYGVRFEEYQKWDAVNNSVLKILSDERRCPAHAKYYLENGLPDTPALRFGRALDCYILEPTHFVELYEVEPVVDRRTKLGRLEWEHFQQQLGKKESISQEDYEKIISIFNKVIDSQAMRLIEGGKSQVCAVWEDKITGLTCKARWDYYQEEIPMITDLKSTGDASPDGFSFDIFKYAYFQQAGFYCMGHEVLTDDDPCFAIFAIEKEPPFVHSTFDLGMKSIEAGKNAARKALAIYAKCKKSGVWPQYSDKITILDMPVWALQKYGIDQYQM